MEHLDAIPNIRPQQGLVEHRSVQPETLHAKQVARCRDDEVKRRLRRTNERRRQSDIPLFQAVQRQKRTCDNQNECDSLFLIRIV